MADEKITPAAPPAALTESPRYTVNKELDEREARARKAFETSHTELFPDPAAPPAAAVPDAAEAPAELPTEPVESDAPPIEAPSVHPEEAPAPPAAVSPALAISPESAAPPEEKGNFDWRKYRQLERENKRLKAESEARAKAAAPRQEPQQAPTTPEVQPAYDETDPFGVKAAAADAAAKVRKEMQEQFEEQRRKDDWDRTIALVDQQERQFEQSHPGYYDAVNYLESTERRRFQLAGDAHVKASEMLNDKQWEGSIEKVADDFVFLPDPNRPATLLIAKRQGLTPEQMAAAREMSDYDAAVALATDLHIREHKQRIFRNSKATGRSVPDMVWDEAVNGMGYTPKVSSPPALTNGSGNTATNGQSVAERVRQSARATAAGKSLSSVSGAPTDGTVAQQQIKTLRDYMELRNRDPQAARAYNERMQKVDPAWHTRLAP